ncbi:MAG: RsmB/NOP family class I SAM-dependent RNA methyltransferase [Candidatus Odinarchaeota archaeon]
MINELAENFGYHPYMIKRYIQFLGENNTKKLLEANERPLNPSIRVNTLKTSVVRLKERLENKNFKLRSIERVPYGFEVLESKLNLGSTHEYLQGYYYVQNIASMFPALILDPKPTEIVIDMCAAPGSKSTHLAQIMENQGTLICLEKNRNRIPSLELNLRRMGISNSIILNFDAIKLTQLKIKADKVLLDAPCTGEGLIREDPSRKKSRSIKDINKMASIQKKLLDIGLKILNPGGKLLYSTCSIAPEENEFVINEVLQNLSDYSISKIDSQYGVNGLTEVFGYSLMSEIKLSQRLYPHLHNTIGFYLCLIKKNL